MILLRALCVALVALVVLADGGVSQHPSASARVSTVSGPVTGGDGVPVVATTSSALSSVGYR